MRRYDLDKPGMLRLAAGFVGMGTLSCIEAYAHKRKIVLHRAARAFWALVAESAITTKSTPEGLEIITAVELDAVP
jgi:hypothetical protein